MNNFSFADRYAEAGLAPTSAVISTRQQSAGRIIAGLTNPQIFDLVQLYFGREINPTWLRDEIVKDDSTFSLIANKREAVILSAIILGSAIDKGNDIAILAILTANLAGIRSAPEAPWLVEQTEDALTAQAVAHRKPQVIETSIKYLVTPKLAEEITAASTDPALLAAALAKVRHEGIENAKSISTAESAALSTVSRRLQYLQEETQMLWWLFGEHSSTLSRPFRKLPAAEVAITAAIELADLTTASRLGPVAAPALLERVIALSRVESPAKSLSEVIDTFQVNDIQKFALPDTDGPEVIFPIVAAIKAAVTIGRGSWQGLFERKTGINPSAELGPLELSTQLYRELLLGQLL